MEVVFLHCSSLKLLNGCILVLMVYIIMFVDKFNFLMLVVTIWRCAVVMLKTQNVTCLLQPVIASIVESFEFLFSAHHTRCSIPVLKGSL
jgi:hypothetical protein